MSRDTEPTSGEALEAYLTVRVSHNNFPEVSSLTENQSKYVCYGQIGQVHVRRVSMNNR